MMKCNICGNTKNNTRWEVREMMFGFRDTFTYYQCTKCECLQISKVPDNLDKYYPNNYYSFQSAHTHKFSTRLKNLFKKRRDRSALYNTGLAGNFLNTFFPNKKLEILSEIHLNDQSRILDVGCGTGHLLYSLREIGFRNLLGTDPFLDGDIEYENGLKVLNKSIFEVKGEWDLIMFHHSFEHIPNPAETLNKVYDLLSDDGVCLIRVPTVSSFAWEHYRENWVQLDAPRHFFIHSIKSIKLLAERADLRLEKTVYDSNALQFWGSEQYLRDIPLKSSKSYGVSKSDSIFTRNEIKVYQKKARKMNEQNRGDTCAFFLVKT